MKTFIVLIALAWLVAGCATYSDRGAPGYPEGVYTDTTIRPANPPPAWPEVEVGTPSGGMRRERLP